MGSAPTPPGFRIIRTWEEADALRPDIAFIANPTHLHIPASLACARTGAHLFLEKPIGHTREGLPELLDCVRSRGLTAYVAYNLRFHPVIETLKEMIAGKEVASVEVVCTSYLPDWRPGRNHLDAYSAKSAMGGGVLLDLSHELDYIDHIFGPVLSIQGEFGRRSDVTTDAEDFALLEVGTPSVPRISVRLDIAERKVSRTVDIAFRDGSQLSGDLIASRITGSGLPGPIEPPYHPNLTYEKQLRYFLDHIGAPGLMNNLLQAAPLFERIVAFKEEK